MVRKQSELKYIEVKSIVSYKTVRHIFIEELGNKVYYINKESESDYMKGLGYRVSWCYISDCFFLESKPFEKLTPQVKDKLRGQWIKLKNDENSELEINGFDFGDNSVRAGNGAIITLEKLFDEWLFLNGDVIGIEVRQQIGS